MEVSKISFGKRTVVLHVEKEVKAVGSERTYKKDSVETCWAPPSEDFKEAVAKLNQVVFSYLPVEKKKFNEIKVGSISLTQEDDGYGLVISSKAIIKNDLPWNFNTPYLSPELLDAGIQDTIDTIISEALKYEQGTFAPELDLSPAEEKEVQKTDDPPEKEESKKSGLKAVAA